MLKGNVFRSQRVAAESAEVGESIITDLGTQREALERTRERLGEADEELARSRRVIRRIYRSGKKINEFSLHFIQDL